MAYTPTKWNDGDVITAEKLNKLEEGVKNEQVGPAGPAGAKGEKGDTGAQGAAGKSMQSMALTTDSSGKVTGGTITFTDHSTAAITVTVAGS